MLGLTLGGVHSVDLDKGMTYIHHCNIIQTSFTAIKILSGLLVCLFIRPSPQNSCKVIYLESYSI